MKHLRLYIYIVTTVLWTATVSAKSYDVSSSAPTHWLGVSVMGVEANSLLGGNTDAFMRPGGGGQFTFFYEVQKKAFFFNVGLGMDYVLTASALKEHTDAFTRVDYYDHDVLTYRYIYSHYEEKQTQLRLLVPVQFGYRFGDWFYIGLGAAFRLSPLLNSFNTTTRMYAEGEYDKHIGPIRDADVYGFWSDAEYKGSGSVRSAAHEVAVEAEFGARVPLAKKVEMRAGVYLGYDIPLSSYSQRATTPLVDYSAVDVNPATQSKANLEANIRFNSMYDTSVLNREVQRIRVGLRLTFLFNVAQSSKPCMCKDYYR